MLPKNTKLTDSVEDEWWFQTWVIFSTLEPWATKSLDLYVMLNLETLKPKFVEIINRVLLIKNFQLEDESVFTKDSLKVFVDTLIHYTKWQGIVLNSWFNIKLFVIWTEKYYIIHMNDAADSSIIMREFAFQRFLKVNKIIFETNLDVILKNIRYQVSRLLFRGEDKESILNIFRSSFLTINWFVKEVPDTIEWYLDLLEWYKADPKLFALISSLFWLIYNSLFSYSIAWWDYKRLEPIVENSSLKELDDELQIENNSSMDDFIINNINLFREPLSMYLDKHWSITRAQAYIFFNITLNKIPNIPSHFLSKKKEFIETVLYFCFFIEELPVMMGDNSLWKYENGWKLYYVLMEPSWVETYMTGDSLTQITWIVPPESFEEADDEKFDLINFEDINAVTNFVLENLEFLGSNLLAIYEKNWVSPLNEYKLDLSYWFKQDIPQKYSDLIVDKALAHIIRKTNWQFINLFGNEQVFVLEMWWAKCYYLQVGDKTHSLEMIMNEKEFLKYIKDHNFILESDLDKAISYIRTRFDYVRNVLWVTDWDIVAILNQPQKINILWEIIETHPEHIYLSSFDINSFLNRIRNTSLQYSREFWDETKITTWGKMLLEIVLYVAEFFKMYN